MVGREKAGSVGFHRKFRWVDNTSFNQHKDKTVEQIVAIPERTFYTSRNQIEIHNHDLKTIIEEDGSKFSSTKSRYLTEQVLWFILEGKLQELRKQDDRLYEPVLLEYLSHDLGNQKYVKTTKDPETLVEGRELKDIGQFKRDHRAEYLEACEGKDMLIIPLGEGAHYTLCIVKVKEATIEFFDSQIQKKRPTDVHRAYPSVFDLIFRVAGEDKILEPLKWKLVQEVLGHLFPNTLRGLKKIVHTNLPQQVDNFSCGFFVMMYACFTMRGEVMDPAVHNNDYVVTTFRRSLVKYMLQQTDERDPSKVQPGKPSSSKLTDITNDKSLSDEAMIVEDATASDIKSTVEAEPVKPVKHVHFRCDSPEFHITDSEDEPDAIEPQDEDGPVAVGSEPKLEHNFSNNYSLKNDFSGNEILNYVDSKALEKLIDIPFIGKDERNHNKTYNNPSGKWQVMRSFTEIKEFINGDGSLRFTQKVKDVIQEELAHNPVLFVEWLKGRSGGAYSKVNRFDFCWSDSSAYRFVRTEIKKMEWLAPPENPCAEKERRRKALQRTRKRHAATAAKAAARAATAAKAAARAAKNNQ